MLAGCAAVSTTREYAIYKQRQLFDLGFHSQSDEADGCARIEDYHEQQPSSDVRDVNGFLLALVNEAREIVFSDQSRQLIVRTIVCGRKCREGSRVQSGRVPNGGDELSRPIDEKSAPGICLPEESLQRVGNCSEVVLSERPVCRTGGHLAP